MKKIMIQVLSSFLVSSVFAVGSALFFINYGGNRCGSVCNCFCCHMFNSRGYEACGQFGFYFGAGLGLVLMIVFFVWWNKRKR